MRSAKVEIDIGVTRGSIREYRMECTGGARSTVRTATRPAARIVATAVGVAALVTGGVIADAPQIGGPELVVVDGPATVVALPHSIGAANRAW